MKNLNIVAAALALLLPSIAFSQSVSRAKDLISKQQYKQAAMELRPLAEKGDAEAQTLSAELFFDGNGVIKSVDQGKKYATLAAEQGYLPAIQLLAAQFEKADNAKGEVELITKYIDRFEDVAESELRIRLAELYRDQYDKLGLSKTDGVNKGWETIRQSVIGYQFLCQTPAEWFAALIDANNYNGLSELADYLVSELDFEMLDVLCNFITDPSVNPSALTEEQCKQAADGGDPFYCAFIADNELNKEGRDRKQNVAEARSYISKANVDNAEEHPFFNMIKKRVDPYYLPGDRVEGYLVYDVDPTCLGALVVTDQMNYYDVPKIADFKELGRTWRFPSKEECEAIEKLAKENKIDSHIGVASCKGSRDKNKHKLYMKEVLVTEFSDGKLHTHLICLGKSPSIRSVERVWNLGPYTRVDIHLWWLSGRNPAPERTPFSEDATIKCKNKTYKLLRWSYTTTPRAGYSKDKDADMTLYFERIPDDWSSLSISMPGCWDMPSVKWHLPYKFE